MPVTAASSERNF